MKSFRLRYFLIFVATIILGLCSRRYGAYLSSFIADYAGDTLWAMMVYFGFRILFPYTQIFRIIIIALVFSYAIEISQLYQAEWINTVRNTLLGALILGHGFLWSDIVCYTVGVLLALGLDYLLFRKKE